MALPAIEDVRRALPPGALAVAARPAVAPLFRLVPEVRAITLPARRWPDGRDLTGQRFDAAIALPNSFHAALLLSRARVPERWGYRTDWRGRLLTRSVPPPRRVHQVEYYRHLVSALGFANGPAEPRLVVAPDVRVAADALLRNAGWNGTTPLAAIAPGAAYGSAKRWPPESFAALADELTGDGIRVVIVGSAADRPVAAEVLRAGKRAGVLDLTGATDLASLAGVFTHCRCLVTNDSGAMHLAAAVGTPVTAVFGPTDDRATSLRGDAHRSIVGEAWCRPCMLRECPIDHHCMRSIAAADVAAAARRSL